MMGIQRWVDSHPGEVVARLQETGTGVSIMREGALLNLLHEYLSTGRMADYLVIESTDRLWRPSFPFPVHPSPFTELWLFPKPDDPIADIRDNAGRVIEPIDHLLDMIAIGYGVGRCFDRVEAELDGREHFAGSMSVLADDARVILRDVYGIDLTPDRVLHYLGMLKASYPKRPWAYRIKPRKRGDPVIDPGAVAVEFWKEALCLGGSTGLGCERAG